ncbi:MAG: hypothetical protein DRG27_06975 [Deltaproteobacteria bacterium]|nr:MAG: hypothetical protein DRG27_06975 [Deltaproteobacteria bacterium]
MVRSTEDKIREIVELIDESDDYWRKAAFYSDPDVSALLDSLYERWESSSMQGVPLDYATDEEVDFLYHKARSLTREDARRSERAFFKKSMGIDEEIHEDKDKHRKRRFFGLLP